MAHTLLGSVLVPVSRNRCKNVLWWVPPSLRWRIYTIYDMDAASTAWATAAGCCALQGERQAHPLVFPLFRFVYRCWRFSLPVSPNPSEERLHTLLQSQLQGSPLCGICCKRPKWAGAKAKAASNSRGTLFRRCPRHDFLALSHSLSLSLALCLSLDSTATIRQSALLFSSTFSLQCPASSDRKWRAEGLGAPTPSRPLLSLLKLLSSLYIYIYICLCLRFAYYLPRYSILSVHSRWLTLHSFAVSYVLEPNYQKSPLHLD